tara:strand:+ start:383 stop:643 length:261 start_codon:yes stop_codon:yes gene_type:complete
MSVVENDETIGVIEDVNGELDDVMVWLDYVIDTLQGILSSGDVEVDDDTLDELDRICNLVDDSSYSVYENVNKLEELKKDLTCISG